MKNYKNKILPFLFSLLFTIVVFTLLQDVKEYKFVVFYNFLIFLFALYFVLYHKKFDKFDLIFFIFLILVAILLNLLSLQKGELGIIFAYIWIFIILIISPAILTRYKVQLNEKINVELYKPLISKIIELDTKIMEKRQLIEVLEKNKTQTDIVFTMMTEINRKNDIFEVLHIFGNLWTSKMGFDNFIIFFQSLDFELPEGANKFSINLNQDMRNYVQYIQNKISHFFDLQSLSSYSVRISDDEEFLKLYKPHSSIHSFILIPMRVSDKYKVSIGFFTKDENEPSPEQFNAGIVAANNFSLSLNRVLLYYKVKAMSIQDGLTGLYLHRFFMETLEGEVERARRYKTELALIMLDIDHFKQFNDNYGHLVGDDVLAGVGHVIRNTVDKDMIPARYGGEEFIIICPRPAKIIDFAQQLKKNIETFTVYDEGTQQNLHINISMGIAFLDDNDDSPHAIIKKVDNALYYAKNHGRNKIVYYPDKIVV